MALEWPDFENEQKKKMKAKKAKGFIASDSEDSGDFKPKKKRKESGLLFQVEVRMPSFLAISHILTMGCYF